MSHWQRQTVPAKEQTQYGKRISAVTGEPFDTVTLKNSVTVSDH